MTTTKPASTIMLARDYKGALEVLLLRRNKALVFAGGLWVFPGGKLEAFEIDETTDELAAAKLAAVRETKEEANININPDNLFFFRHWTTPVGEPRRFSTYFFFGEANHLTSDVEIDDSEIKEHLWIQPRAALDALRTGKLPMMPPTIMSLQLIENCQSVGEAREIIYKEKPIYVLPVLGREGRKVVCMYEGDAGYSSGNAEVLGARHRLVLDMKKGDFLYEFKDCEEGIKRINGHQDI